MKSIETLPHEEHTLDDGSTIQLKTWLVRSADERPEFGELSPTGTFADAIAFYNGRHVAALDQRIACVLPYTEIDDHEVTVTFGDAFRSRRDVATHVGRHERPTWSLKLARYARLRLNRKIARDERVTHLCNMYRKHGVWHAAIAAGPWSEGLYSMDSSGLVLEVKEGDTDELRTLAERLVATYGNVDLRTAASRHVGKALPPFWQGAVQYNLGVGGSIYTSDGYVVITRRHRGVHINVGRIYGAGGGVVWNPSWDEQPHLAEKQGLIGILEQSMAKEMREEIGLTPEDTNIVPVAFVRELHRSGSPEALYCLATKLKAEEVVVRIASNPHPDCAEVDGYVYAINPEDIPRMLRNQNGTNIIPPKGMIILHAIAKHHLGIF